MNSNYGKSNKPSSLNNYGFDFGGLGSNRSRPLNEQKSQTASSFTSSQSKPNTSSSWQPRPSWTHQPAAIQPAPPGLNGPSSMVGDIFGKTWSSSSSSSTATSSSIGIANKNPNLFGDLVGSALGQSKANSNVPLKVAAPVSASGSNKGAYSMGNLADSLPKTGNLAKGSGNWGSSESFGSYTSANNSSANTSNVNSMKSGTVGGPAMRSGGGMGSNKDPFGSLVDFGSKPMGSLNSATKGTNNNNSTSKDDAFGYFQNASKSSTPTFDPFPQVKSNPVGSNSGSYSRMDDFAVPTPQNQPPVQSSGGDVFDSLFTSSSASVGGSTNISEEIGSQQFSGGDDWGMDTGFGGGNDTGGTTELEGLPPPPTGFSATAAKNKGMDNYKQGQYADAIKWLSWAVILLEKAGDDAATMEVLSSRASCYKEVGEYKKAVADCTKVLERDGENVAVLVQRALLYESMEKYKLGAEDLRIVMKLDPGNRVARSTIHRLTKMAG
ncbi:uncharacterized serine-rich protein C215.13-like [Diospyros lotus]|uniref:uncharacterized serine-rich protein C215.13-like n=1 Tax=Diospyros lotus TaxID=55363 RepID=UPI0022581D25|nr:uncharacterized serine-rich protein C215.13-like [Diospyros lotus]XP_052188453.1 uncharacterized serine-rich protein C215.13-like [Diospyros lotus]